MKSVEVDRQLCYIRLTLADDEEGIILY
jgi:hypothetical protein